MQLTKYLEYLVELRLKSRRFIIFYNCLDPRPFELDNKHRWSQCRKLLIHSDPLTAQPHAISGILREVEEGLRNSEAELCGVQNRTWLGGIHGRSQALLGKISL